MYVDVSCPFFVNSSVFKEIESINLDRKIVHIRIELRFSRTIIFLVMDPFNCLVNVSCPFW